MEPTAPTPQQVAVQAVRARYERGELAFDAFHRALDALLLAQDADECQAILRALPPSPQLALSALDAAPLAQPPAPNIPAPAAPPARGKWFVAVLSQTKKLRRRWRLAPNTRALALLGEVKLDLNQADLPPQARLRVTAVLGTVTIYVPRRMRVRVRSTVLLSDVNALGESMAGVVAFGQEEHEPPPTSLASATPPSPGIPDVPDPPQLDIAVFSLMGNVQVKLTDRPLVSVGEVMREVVAVAAAGIHRGLRQQTNQRALSDRAGDER